MRPRHGRGQVGQIRAKSTCIIVAGISLETTGKPDSEAVMADASKPRAFAASELVHCGACSRANSPTRGSCMYCGTALEITRLNAFAPAPAETEATADVCFHVVAVPPAQIDEAALGQLAALLNIKPSELRSLFVHAPAAPVLAVNSEKQARLAAEKLREHGIGTRVISDGEIDIFNPPLAVSRLEIRDAEVIGRFGQGKHAVAASWDEIRLVVSGRLYFETREIEQKRSRAKQLIDEREILTDEAVLDIYPRTENRGWRIRADNFDFSCLGAAKRLTAFENFTALKSLLSEHAMTAVFDDSYLRVRRALDSVWPSEPNALTKDSRRNAFGNFDSSVTSTNNEFQFTRYSRLLRQLLAPTSEDHA